MKILTFLICIVVLLGGCTSQTARIHNSKPTPTLIYTEDDNFKSKRVDYLGYGLGGTGFGGYGMGGYGLAGYAGQIAE